MAIVAEPIETYTAPVKCLGAPAGGPLPTLVGDHVRCFEREDSGHVTEYIQVLDGTSTDQLGGVWWDIDRPLGNGAIALELVIETRLASPRMGPAMSGGFAISFTSGPARLGNIVRHGMPLGEEGIGLEYEWTDVNESMGPPLYIETDGYRVRRTADHVPLGELTEVEFSPTSSGPHFNGQTTFLTQELYFEYRPDDPNTDDVDEERILFRRGRDGPTMVSFPEAREGDRYTRMDDEIAIGTPLSIGFTASTRDYPAEMRIFVKEFEIIMGPPDLIFHGDRTYEGLCSED